MRYLMVAIIALLVPAAAMANKCKADKKTVLPGGTRKERHQPLPSASTWLS